jgi:hypothetical protein
MLTTEQIHATGAWIAAHQRGSGEIPWWQGGKTDPWDHVHAAMGLTVAGRIKEAAAAYRFLARTQQRSGGWPASRTNGRTTDATQETNHAAYVATGLWHYYCATRRTAFLVEHWPMVERAIRFALRLQDESGAISWAVAPDGSPWRAPLLTGSSSIHGSLVCAIRIAELLGYERPEWHAARARLKVLLCNNIRRFDSTDLPEPPGRYSMDWYYPVLGGAIRGEAARERLLDPAPIATFVADGVGCRCVRDRPWYTVAESSELVLALDACGLGRRAEKILQWMEYYRMEDGGYWTGRTWPEDVFWPVESNTWTAAAVLIADDAVAGCSATSDLFRSLSGDDLIGTRRAIAS